MAEQTVKPTEFRSESRGESRPPGRPSRRGGRSAPEPAVGPDGKPVEELSEKVLFINRSAKVVKGGRRFSFSALVVVGDHKGQVGLGLGKANEVAEAIRKGNDVARRNMIDAAMDRHSIPHETLSVYDGARILLKPASPGTGIIAGKTVRAILEAAGYKNILSKSLGSRNPANMAKATLQALQTLRMKDEIYRDRGMARNPVSPTKEAEQ